MMAQVTPEGRLRALAFNVVQEARRAAGHADAAWTDDDARKCDMIFKILGALENVEAEKEIGVMVPKVQPITRPALINVERLLEDMNAAESADEASPIRARLPGSK